MDWDNLPLRKYIIRNEGDVKYLYFEVPEMLHREGYGGDDPIDIERETKGPRFINLCYQNLGIKVDGKWVYRFAGVKII
jgi:hypothetical protein